MNSKIHPAAIVDPGAGIGEGVCIGPYTIVEKDVEIGDGTRIDTCARIASGARIGADCHIFHGAVIGEVPQDLKFKGEETLAVIGDRTQVREYATVHRGTKARTKTEIGSDCLIMAYAHVAHDCIIGNQVIMANTVQLGGHITIDDSAYIGGLTGVHQFTHIGRHAFVGGASRCTQDVPPFILAAGEPLRYSGLNVVGLRRNGFASEKIALLKEVYRLIYRSDFNISQSLEQIRNGFEMTDEILAVISFIEGSQRGIVY